MQFDLLRGLLGEMKAGSLLRMTTLLRCERVERRHPQEKCASKCVRGTFTLCLHLFFSTKCLRSKFENPIGKSLLDLESGI